MSRRAPCSKCSHHPGDPVQRYPDVIEHGLVVAVLPPFSSAWGIEETIRDVDGFSEARVDWCYGVGNLPGVKGVIVKAVGAELREVQRLLFSLGLNFDPNAFDLPGLEIFPELVERNRFTPRGQG